jgi:hypothetical protein
LLSKLLQLAPSQPALAHCLQHNCRLPPLLSLHVQHLLLLQFVLLLLQPGTQHVCCCLLHQPAPTTGLQRSCCCLLLPEHVPGFVSPPVALNSACCLLAMPLIVAAPRSVNALLLAVHIGRQPQLLLPELLLLLLMIPTHLQQHVACFPARVQPLQALSCLQDSCELLACLQTACMPLYADGCPLLHQDCPEVLCCCCSWVCSAVADGLVQQAN